MEKKLDKITDILASTSKNTSLVFYKDGYRLYFKDWNLPFSGQILIWENKFINKEPMQYEKAIENLGEAEMFFDIDWFPDYTIRDIKINFKRGIYALIVKEAGQFKAILYKEYDARKVIYTVENINNESDSFLAKDYYLFTRAELDGRPSELWAVSLDDFKEKLIYEEESTEARLRLSGTINEEEVVLARMFYDQAFYAITDLNSESIVFSSQTGAVISSGIGTIAGEDYVFLVEVDDDTAIRCIGDEEFSLLITHQVINIKGGPDWCLVHYLVDGALKLGVIDLSQDMYGLTREVVINELSENISDVRLYQNNYCPNELYLYQVRDNVYHDYYSYNLDNNELVELFSLKIAGADINKKEIVVESSIDGQDIPVSLFKRNGINSNGLFVLYLYGAYGEKELDGELDPLFIALIELGATLCVGHIRGGGWLGKSWHDGGRKMNKWNSITDAIDICKFIKENYCPNCRLGIFSMSAGGVVAGAILNEVPELVDSMFLVAPFINPLGEMQDKTNSLTQLEIEEWGDLDNPEVYNYVSSYSPLQNVEKIKGRSNTKVRVYSGIDDPYVNYSDQLKWVEKLKEENVDVEHFVNRTGGHDPLQNKTPEELAEILIEFIESLKERGD